MGDAIVTADGRGHGGGVGEDNEGFFGELEVHGFGLVVLKMLGFVKSKVILCDCEGEKVTRLAGRRECWKWKGGVHAKMGMVGVAFEKGSMG